MIDFDSNGNEILTTKDGKPLKVDQFANGAAKLTDAQKQCGSLKGKVKYYSEALRCTFYLRKGQDPIEVENRFIEARNRF